MNADYECKHVSRRLFCKYFQGELSDEKAMEIEEHMDGCDRCAAEARLVRSWLATTRESGESKLVRTFLEKVRQFGKEKGAVIFNFLFSNGLASAAVLLLLASMLCLARIPRTASPSVVAEARQSSETDSPQPAPEFIAPEPELAGEVSPSAPNSQGHVEPAAVAVTLLTVEEPTRISDEAIELQPAQTDVGEPTTASRSKGKGWKSKRDRTGDGDDIGIRRKRSISTFFAQTFRSNDAGHSRQSRAFDRKASEFFVRKGSESSLAHADGGIDGMSGLGVRG